MSKYYVRITDWGASTYRNLQLNTDYNLPRMSDVDFVKLLAFLSPGFELDMNRYGSALLFDSDTNGQLHETGITASFANVLISNKGAGIPKYLSNASMRAYGIQVNETRQVLEEQVGSGGEIMDVQGEPFLGLMQDSKSFLAKIDREQKFLKMEEEEGQVHEKAEEINPDQPVSSLPPKIPTDEIPELEITYVGGEHGDVDDMTNNLGNAGTASGRVNPQLFNKPINEAVIGSGYSEKLESQEADVTITSKKENGDAIPAPTKEELSKLDENVEGKSLEELFAPSAAMKWDGDKRSGKKEDGDKSGGYFLLTLGAILGGLYVFTR